jgi:hypothetical protein
VERSPRSSGVYLVDAEGIVSRALACVGLAPQSKALVAELLAASDMKELPTDAERLWMICQMVLLPLVRERAGTVVAESLAARLEGALVALDTIQHGRGPAFTRE